MTVPSDLLAHKTLMLAMLICADEIGGDLGLEPGTSLAAMTRQLGTSRTSVYEQKERLLRAVSELAGARPGRPAAAEEAPPKCCCQSLELTVRVQAFRLQHLDAVIEHGSRTSYSPSFRRFILDQLDGWQCSRAAFAEATSVPPDTLADWVQADAAGVSSPALAREPVWVPVDASETTRSILHVACPARGHGVNVGRVENAPRLGGRLR